MNNNEIQKGGIGFASILGLIFITLKLSGKIAWSWAWVLAPFWVPFALAIVVFAICLIVALLS